MKEMENYSYHLFLVDWRSMASSAVAHSSPGDKICSRCSTHASSCPMLISPKLYTPYCEREGANLCAENIKESPHLLSTEKDERKMNTIWRNRGNYVFMAGLW